MIRCALCISSPCRSFAMSCHKSAQKHRLLPFTLWLHAAQLVLRHLYTRVLRQVFRITTTSNPVFSLCYFWHASQIRLQAHLHLQSQNYPTDLPYCTEMQAKSTCILQKCLQPHCDCYTPVMPVLSYNMKQIQSSLTQNTASSCQHLEGRTSMTDYESFLTDPVLADLVDRHVVGCHVACC